MFIYIPVETILRYMLGIFGGVTLAALGYLAIFLELPPSEHAHTVLSYVALVGISACLGNAQWLVTLDEFGGSQTEKGRQWVIHACIICGLMLAGTLLTEWRYDQYWQQSHPEETGGASAFASMYCFLSATGAAGMIAYAITWPKCMLAKTRARRTAIC